MSAGEETRAAAAAQLGGLDLLDHQLRVGVDQHLVKRLVAAHGDVLFDIVGADEAAVAQHDLFLRLEERQRRCQERDLGKAGAVLDVGGQVVPLFDLAQGQDLRDAAFAATSSRMRADVARLDAPQHHQRLAGQAHIHQRFLRAESEAADRRQLDVAALLADGFGEGMVDALGAVAGAAGAHADSDARPRGHAASPCRLRGPR